MGAFAGFIVDHALAAPGSPASFVNETGRNRQDEKRMGQERVGAGEEPPPSRLSQQLVNSSGEPALVGRARGPNCTP